MLTQTRLVPSWMAFVLAGIAVECAAAVPPRLLCYSVMPGDTVTAVSIRLTRNPQSWRGAGFQILDPAAARFVPKRDYAHLHPGLQACIVEPLVARSRFPDLGWWLLLLLCSAGMASLFAVQSAIDRRTSRALALEKFGNEFIREFKRPLIDERGPQSVLRAELELSPDRRSLEVRFAPAEGRRYPNLADHRTNLEYDIQRVVSLLNDRRFTYGPLRARGPWVAIPFRLKPDPRKGR